MSKENIDLYGENHHLKVENMRLKSENKKLLLDKEGLENKFSLYGVIYCGGFKNEIMQVQIPKKYEDVEINKEDWFIAKSNTNFIKIQLPKPKVKWWIDGYTSYDTFFEVILVDGKQKR